MENARTYEGAALQEDGSFTRVTADTAEERDAQMEAIQPGSTANPQPLNAAQLGERIEQGQADQAEVRAAQREVLQGASWKTELAQQQEAREGAQETQETQAAPHDEGKGEEAPAVQVATAAGLLSLLGSLTPGQLASVGLSRIAAADPAVHTQAPVQPAPVRPPVQPTTGTVPVPAAPAPEPVELIFQAPADLRGQQMVLPNPKYKDEYVKIGPDGVGKCPPDGGLFGPDGLSLVGSGWKLLSGRPLVQVTAAHVPIMANGTMRYVYGPNYLANQSVVSPPPLNFVICFNDDAIGVAPENCGIDQIGEYTLGDVVPAEVLAVLEAEFERRKEAEKKQAVQETIFGYGGEVAPNEFDRFLEFDPLGVPDGVDSMPPGRGPVVYPEGYTPTPRGSADVDPRQIQTALTLKANTHLRETAGGLELDPDLDLGLVEATDQALKSEGLNPAPATAQIDREAFLRDGKQSAEAEKPKATAKDPSELQEAFSGGPLVDSEGTPYSKTGKPLVGTAKNKALEAINRHLNPPAAPVVAESPATGGGGMDAAQIALAAAKRAAGG